MLICQSYSIDVVSVGGIVKSSDSLECINVAAETRHCTQIKSILIIEDSPFLLKYISDSLTKELQVKCDTALTEQEAMERLESKVYDLVVMDIHLPDSSGNFIGALIRKKNRIIIITGAEDEDNRAKLVSLPIVDYLYKTDERTVVSYLINAIKRLRANANTVVAVCDDSKLSRLQTTQMLRNQNLSYIELLDGQQAHDCILKQGLKVDLIISDVNMPRMDGFDLIRIIRHTHTKNELPIMALSASTKPSIVSQLLKIGANDYVSKPISNEEFLTRLNTMLDQSRLYAENKVMIKELKLAATTDFLTKLYNRNFFYSSLKHIQAQAKREGYQYGIVMLDIDHFKYVNDNYGHESGDIALKNVASIIKKSVRESDIACRWGGEEFLILVPKTNLTELVQFSERLRKRIESSPIVIEPKILEFTISASFGVSLGDDDNVENVIAKADECLYKAKESGRNAVGFK